MSYLIYTIVTFLIIYITIIGSIFYYSKTFENFKETLTDLNPVFLGFSTFLAIFGKLFFFISLGILLILIVTYIGTYIFKKIMNSDYFEIIFDLKEEIKLGKSIS